MARSGDASLDAKFRKIRPEEQIQTGIISFDTVMAGGMYEGDVIEITSESGTGKTTLALHVALCLARQGWETMYLDFEGGVKDRTLHSIGFSGEYLDRFHLYDNVVTFGHAEELIMGKLGIDDKVLLGKAPPRTDESIKLVVIDSLANIMSDGTITRSMNEALEIGASARMLSTFLPKLRVWARSAYIVVICINHLRNQLNLGKPVQFGGGSKVVSYGGNSVQYNPDVRLRMESSKALKKKESTMTGTDEEAIYGHMSRAFCLKNRNGRPHIKVHMPIIFGRGVSNQLTVLEIMKAHGFIGGTTWKTVNFPPCDQWPEGFEGKYQGFTNLINEFIVPHYEEVASYLRDNGYLGLTLSDDEIRKIEEEEADIAEATE